MLAKKARLTASEVREILKSGRSARAGTLSVKYISSTGSLPAQTGKAAVVVSSKVAKTAVLRNRLRRSAYRTLRTALPRNIRAVFFLHKPLVDNAELTHLCSKLS